ncbi:MAG: GTP 3',8-cyclase MoaA [Finegoldia magna]|uniref:GTP 3',8-cyclase MoaA n=1 Tax=Finegoldia magna TaxID=1260 RepID=UPI0029085498|nr:GTP 3',8-cyclase MoaA [Finegoldia magna]MDU6598896.1 GTP 3',8-cyclase MoaA [Finegoldia magna]MDU7141216.1 GTP 3',8-cyclase MoaA [Finegoldia magna]
MKDALGRKIDYLRISVTDKCNLRCKYCMPEEGITHLNHDEILTIDETLKIVEVFKDLGIKKVRLTGGEPLVRNGILDLVKGIKDMGIEEICMTTNAIKLYDMADDLRKNGVDRFNISLDTLHADKFFDITRGGDLKKVLKSIDKLKQMDMEPIKINTVVMRHFNYDEIEDFVKFAENGVIVRFIELMPIGEAIGKSDDYVSNEEIIKKIGNLQKIDSDSQKSKVAEYYTNPNGAIVGFINPISHKFCSECNRVRLDCKGNLLMCLHSNKSINLKDCIRNGEDIRQIITQEIYNKPERHYLEEGNFNKRDMNTIGG